MSRVLRAVPLDEHPRDVGLDHHAAVLAEAEQRAFDAGHAAGFRDGHARGVEEGRRDLAVVAGVITQAVEDVRATLAASRQELGAEVRRLALDVARAVCERGVTDDGVALAERVELALSRIDDAPLRVHVNPTELVALQDLLAGQLRSVDVVPDATLGAGEARILGPWSDADLTWDATWEAVGEVLAGD